MFLPLSCVPLVHMESWAPPLRKGAWPPGPWLVGDAQGRQEADPRDRGSLSACRWAGRPGLCSPAQGLIGCKLIRQLLRLPRRQEKLEGPAQARKWKPHCESCRAVLASTVGHPPGGRCRVSPHTATAAPSSPIEPTVCWAGHITYLVSFGEGGVELFMLLHSFIHPSIHSTNIY